MRRSKLKISLPPTSTPAIREMKIVFEIGYFCKRKQNVPQRGFGQSRPVRALTNSSMLETERFWSGSRLAYTRRALRPSNTEFLSSCVPLS